MGSGGSGAGAGGGGYSGGGLANTGGTGYGGDLGGYGTAGEKSSGAGGSAMAGYGNTGAGGSGMAGISSMSGYTSPGFTPAYGDPRGTSIGMDPYGNYKGSPNYSGIGAPGKPSTMTPKAQMDAFGYVKTSSPPPATFSTAIPTSTQRLSTAPGSTITKNNVGMPGVAPSFNPTRAGGVTNISKNNQGIPGASVSSLGKQGIGFQGGTRSGNSGTGQAR